MVSNGYPERCGLAAQLAQAGDEGLHEGDGLFATGSPGARTQTVVHQHDTARTKERLYAPKHLGGRITSPVFGVGTPGG
jgi:hypothetical protein